MEPKRLSRPRWRPIRTASRDCSDWVLLSYRTMAGTPMVWWGVYDECRGSFVACDMDGPCSVKPTHWMPAPQPFGA